VKRSDRRFWESRAVFVTTHVLSGVLIGRLLKKRPAAALLAGIGSHLVLDAIPHWGCRSGRTHFLTVAKRDGVLGLTAMTSMALAVEPSARVAKVSAMAGAVLLDLDKPFVYFFGIDPFPKAVRRLHRRVQNESSDGLPNELRFGFAFAAADIFTILRARRLG
jgi:hypothetical protein